MYRERTSVTSKSQKQKQKSFMNSNSVSFIRDPPDWYIHGAINFCFGQYVTKDRCLSPDLKETMPIVCGFTDSYCSIEAGISARLLKPVRFIILGFVVTNKTM